MIKLRDKILYEEPISRLVYTLPIEYDQEFYRYDRGRWFKVASSRFQLIMRKLRDPFVKIQMEGLIPYTLEDALGDEEGGNGGHYQEDRYNRRVMLSLQGKKKKVLLLDRLNIYLGGRGNQFEFGDLLLYEDKGPYSIVHVKRKEAGDIDHHRAQVERSADYLATELKKDNARNLLLKGCINGLYMLHGINIKKAKGQGKRLTHGTHFLTLFNTKKQTKKETWANFLNKKIFVNTKSQVKTNTGKLKILLRQIDLDFFKDHQEELVIALDALSDCEKQKNLTQQQVEDFLNAIKQLIDLREILFASGVLKKTTRKNISIIMAVIDDRHVDAIRKATKVIQSQSPKKKKEIPAAKKTLKDLNAKGRAAETELFKKQQLWGLDRTRQAVQKLGFHFNLVVINENTERDKWDAFGAIEDLEVIDSEGEGSTTSDPDSDKTSSKKKKTKGKKKKAKASSPSDQSGSGDSETSKESSSSSQGEESEDDQAQVAGYEYTSTDINRLLHVPLSQNLAVDADYQRFSLSGAAAGDDADTVDIVHRLGKRYVLPPIIAHNDEHEQKDSYEVLMDLLSNTFFGHPTVIAHPPEEILTPFNPGGHWVTFHVQIPAVGNVTYRYIESLLGMQNRDAKFLVAYLRGKYNTRPVHFNTVIRREQPDGVSCGAIITENIKDLFRGVEPVAHAYTLAEILALKNSHRTYLQGVGRDFDF